MSLKKYRNFRS